MDLVNYMNNHLRGFLATCFACFMTSGRVSSKAASYRSIWILINELGSVNDTRNTNVAKNRKNPCKHFKTSTDAGGVRYIAKAIPKVRRYKRNNSCCLTNCRCTVSFIFSNSSQFLAARNVGSAINVITAIKKPAKIEKIVTTVFTALGLLEIIGWNWYPI